jgi:glutaredoxin 2
VTKEQELMQYLHEKVFDPILNSPNVPSEIRSGVNLTIARMNRLGAEKMVQYFWSALATENAIKFSKRMKEEGLTRFEDVMEEFRDKFNDEWLRT